MMAHSTRPKMIRLTELRPPLDHPETALRAAVVTRLGVPESDLQGFSVFRRAPDAIERRLALGYADARRVLDRVPKAAAKSAKAGVN